MPSEMRIFVPLAIREIMNRLVTRIEAVARTSVVQLIDLNPTIPVRISAGVNAGVIFHQFPEQKYITQVFRKFVHRSALRSGLPYGRRSCAGLWSNWD